ncbi:hypothetical protein [Vibrio genomosp. F10]|uniref:hypothetical protein n=1 Tax=Vibrio genomosp. F10 TaxID=723171 RepID=UPI0002F214A2|nr:hypothetical protein [Vibrio genomosp. F10]OEF05708.1 hypothetical protein A1QK_09060 [Vibrio genomosp. F10 str. 9ZD137]
MPIPRDTKAQFIAKSRRLWGDRFGYNEVHYLNSRTPVLLWCKEHNESFSQTPKSHFSAKHACCPLCYKELAGTFQNAWRQKRQETPSGQNMRFHSLMNQVFTQ